LTSRCRVARDGFDCRADSRRGYENFGKAAVREESRREREDESAVASRSGAGSGVSRGNLWLALCPVEVIGNRSKPGGVLLLLRQGPPPRGAVHQLANGAVKQGVDNRRA
jgi:hypothetical protein